RLLPRRRSLRGRALALHLLEPLLERRHPLLERVEAPQAPLRLVQLLRQRGHAVHERLRAGEVGDPADDLLAAIREPGHEVLVLVRLGHGYTLPPFTNA